MKTTIDATALKAMLAFAPSDDIRGYLNGVRVEVHPDHCLLVATDGAVLAVWHVPHNKGAQVEPGSVTVPYPIIKGLKLRRQVPGVSIEATATKVSLHTVDGNAEADLLEGLYVDWRRPVPAKYSGEKATAFAPEQIAKFAAFSKVRCRGTPPAICITENGKSAALVRYSSMKDFFGIVLPVSFKKGFVFPSGVPDWLGGAAPVASVAETFDDLV